MRELLSENYWFIEQDDGNIVLYKKPSMEVLWDKWSYENFFPISPPSHNNPIQNMEPIKIAENVNSIGMSYWRNINNHAGMDILNIFLSIADEIIIFTFDKHSLRVIGERRLGIHHTGEGCYFSAIYGELLYVTSGNQLQKININTGTHEIVWNSEYNLWQCHSDYYGKIHSATLKNSNYDIVGWGLSDGRRFPIENIPDECQIDKSGKWLLIKEKVRIGDSDRWDEYNKIINLNTEQIKIIHNKEGAVGHSDNGFECALGENDFSNFGGALDMIDFESDHKTNIYSTGIWNMGYVSFTNVKPGPIDNQYCLITTPNDLIKVKLDGSGGMKICSNLTESQEYSHRPKANLCPLGEFAIWTAFVNGQLNAYIVKV